jgi:hypothetical protein
VSEQAIDKKRINASPTKEFFIYMLIRDIPLSRAILDLVDNSVDGARRLYPNGDFQDLWVRVELDSTHFRIADNCGGIPVEIARNYAFRFGRPSGAPPTPHSVGQFGVGMKRTFFKLGSKIKIDSTTNNSRFTMDIDVEDWKTGNESANPDDWHFKFDTLSEDLSAVPANDIGTRIEVTQLHESVSQSFALATFTNRLKQELSVAHSLSMAKGLKISVDGIPLNYEPQKLFVSDTLKAVFRERSILHESIDSRAGPPVKVKLYAGLAERSLHDGGWYIFCNGRLILRADQTATTIWGSVHALRQYHPDFARFRGYAYFDSDDSSLLPWTTTKTGVDTDSPVYKTIQQDMVEISKPVLEFLSNLEKERVAVEQGDGITPVLCDTVENAKAVVTNSVPLLIAFVAPKFPPIPSGPKMQKIQYSRPLEEVNKAKKMLQVKTYTAVGEKTFDYFMKYEGKQ